MELIAESIGGCLQPFYTDEIVQRTELVESSLSWVRLHSLPSCIADTYVVLCDTLFHGVTVLCVGKWNLRYTKFLREVGA